MIIRKIAKETGLNEEYLKKLVRSASHRYMVYCLRKKSGGLREIAHPATELKLLQRWLVKNLFSRLNVHHAVYSYRERIGIRDLAKKHYKNKYLLRIDFANFFPSIKGGNSFCCSCNSNICSMPISLKYYTEFCDLL